MNNVYPMADVQCNCNCRVVHSFFMSSAVAVSRASDSQSFSACFKAVFTLRSKFNSTLLHLFQGSETSSYEKCIIL